MWTAKTAQTEQMPRLIYCFLVRHRHSVGFSCHSSFIWASTPENLSSGCANNKGADQPAHMCRLISAFVIRLSKSVISRLTTSEISIFQLVSVAEETALKLALSETLKTGFLTTGPIFFKPESSLVLIT